MATLHQQLQETGQQVLRLQQAMRPQMPAEAFMAYVKGTLVNLTQLKFKKARRDISRILKVATRKNMHEPQEPIDPVPHPPSRPLQVRRAVTAGPRTVEEHQPPTYE